MRLCVTLRDFSEYRRSRHPKEIYYRIISSNTVKVESLPVHNSYGIRNFEDKEINKSKTL